MSLQGFFFDDRIKLAQSKTQIRRQLSPIFQIVNKILSTDDDKGRGETSDMVMDIVY